MFFRNSQEYTLDRNSSYCLALVVVDEYGREIVYPEMAIVYEEDESGGDWTYPDSYSYINDPLEWDY